MRFVRTDGTEVFTYLPEATNCYDAGPVRLQNGPGIEDTSQQMRCTNLDLGRLGALRPSEDTDYRNNDGMDRSDD